MAGWPSVTDPLSFFTIDRGTASVAAALISPMQGRFRLLAASSMPATIKLEAVLADLVARVRSVEPGLLRFPDGWASWVRLEVATAAPRRIVCAAASPSRGAGLADAFAGAGWDVDERSSAGRTTDPVALTQACFDRTVDTIALAAGDPPSSDERSALRELVSVLGLAAGRRDDLSVVLSGGAARYEQAFPQERVASAPMPRPVEGRSGTPLHEFAASLIHRGTSLERAPDGHAAYRASVTSLASLLGRRVDAVDVGHSAGSRVSTTLDGAVEWMTRVDGALVPARAISDEAQIDDIMRWSSLRADDPALRDRVRELGMAPWRDSSETGTRVRAAALRAASGRLSKHWLRSARSDRASDHRDMDSDLIVASGGVMSAIPPGIAAVALLDAFRSPGTVRIMWDHARLLAPIGTIGSETDRQRLLADLLDDALVPLGSALVLADPWPSRSPPVVAFEGALAGSSVTLMPGSLTTVDLPPGLGARAALQGREPPSFRPRRRPESFDVWGGLAGLMLDARPIPLKLPERAAARRILFEEWERPFWPRAVVAG